MIYEYVPTIRSVFFFGGGGGGGGEFDLCSSTWVRDSPVQNSPRQLKGASLCYLNELPALMCCLGPKSWMGRNKKNVCGIKILKQDLIPIFIKSKRIFRRSL